MYSTSSISCLIVTWNIHEFSVVYFQCVVFVNLSLFTCLQVMFKPNRRLLAWSTYQFRSTFYFFKENLIHIFLCSDILEDKCYNFYLRKSFHVLDFFLVLELSTYLSSSFYPPIYLNKITKCSIIFIYQV